MEPRKEPMEPRMELEEEELVEPTKTMDSEE
jgi:hypothetical protein